MAEPIRVLRVIARMNVGGPAHHVSILSGRMEGRGYRTLLVAGHVGAGEASADHLAREHGVWLLSLTCLSPQLHAGNDLRALVALVRVIRRFRPDVVHTHTAKAGFVGRLASVLALRPRPKIVHTYHGHVLEGYFGPVRTTVYRILERTAGRVSDALVGVSQATVDDLVRLRVAPRERFEVVALGLELEPFLALDPVPAADDAVRATTGVRAGELLVSISGRLVPIKRVDIALRAFALARRRGARLRLLVVGDGELVDELQALAAELDVRDAVHFVGFRRDMPAVVAATDIALLTSDNEGTPVSLIEAAAGARPAVSTDVGGVRSVVSPAGGRLSGRGDAPALAEALVELSADGPLRRRMGLAARDHVASRFGAERLVDDIDDLYRSLLAEPVRQ